MKYLIVLVILILASTLVAKEKKSNVLRFYENKIKKTRTKEANKGLPVPVQNIQSNGNDRQSKYPKEMYYDTRYTSGLIGTPTIPVTFNSLEFKDGKTTIGPSMGLGAGYTFGFGDFIFNRDGTITVDNHFVFGLATDVGAKPIEENVEFSATVGGFVGVKLVSIFAGYDIPRKSKTIGIGARFDLSRMKSNIFHPIGKVRLVHAPGSNLKLSEKVQGSE